MKTLVTLTTIAALTLTAPAFANDSEQDNTANSRVDITTTISSQLSDMASALLEEQKASFKESLAELSKTVGLVLKTDLFSAAEQTAEKEPLAE